MGKMEFRDLKKQYRLHRQAIDEAMRAVIEETRFIGGPQVAELEERLAAFAGVRHCIACGNGTDALQLALMAWEIGGQDAVFVPDFTFFSSGEVVPLVGGVPVFVDVDPCTFNIDCGSLEGAIDFVVPSSTNPERLRSVTICFFSRTRHSPLAQA